MKADLEITGAALRLIDGDVFGDPIIGVMHVVGDEGVATLKAMLLKPGLRFTAAVAQAVMAELRRHGFRCVRFSRHTPSGVRWMTRPL